MSYVDTCMYISSAPNTVIKVIDLGYSQFRLSRRFYLSFANNLNLLEYYYNY